MADKFLKIRGARVHNLKNIDVDIPRDMLVIITGLSGSGKSSLAFDTVYAEGHRRFVESLSSYARQFLGQLDKPDVDLIEGLSPSISIDQKTTSKNPRSTIGTVTEIYDYMRLLYSKIGIPHCPVCGKEIKQQTIDEIVDRILTMPQGTRFIILAPVIRGKKGQHEKVLSDARKNGYSRVRVDGEILSLSEDIVLDKNKKHSIDIVVDRLVVNDGAQTRLSDSLETACNATNGTAVLLFPDEDNREQTVSLNYACPEHGIDAQDFEPRAFSFNSPFGACPECEGLGTKHVLSPELVIPDISLSLHKGACAVNGFKSMGGNTWSGKMFNAALAPFGCDIHTPICDMPKEAYDVMMYGVPEKISVSYGKRSYKTNFYGIINEIEKRYELSRNNFEMKEYYEGFMENIPCHVCGGKRLKKEPLCVTVGGVNIIELCDMSVDKELEFFEGLVLSENEKTISKEIIKEIKARLGFLKRVGLGYLCLSRASGTLSGGESQRIRLATQIGSALVGVMYILDEPSIGLHQRDNEKLIETLKSLRDIGNSVIVVEHDEETMLSSDYIIDIGPHAGVHGGRVIAAGSPGEVMANKDSITGAYLSGREKIAVPKKRRTGNGNELTIYGAKENNLKNVDVSIPLGTFTCVTGVSGSGKSSLVNEILYKSLARTLNRANTNAGKHEKICGTEHLDKVIGIDQSPIGRTPRSNPATYTGLFSDIRALFAATQDAKIRGYKQDRFSFNLKGGRCEACQGDGTLKIAMHFLPDVYICCDVCKGKRYNRETLEVKYKGKSIFDVLDMTAEEALGFFENIPSIKRKIKTLCDVGLGYIKLGQSSTTLSGGEAQRVKLATELSRRSTGKTFYILDEPTTGLHSEDVKKLISVLQKLVDAGNTVLVIEHNLDMIKCADYIIDLGPEGGDEGGTVVACGTPEQVAKEKKSYTGAFLQKALDKNDN